MKEMKKEYMRRQMSASQEELDDDFSSIDSDAGFENAPLFEELAFLYKKPSNQYLKGPSRIVKRKVIQRAKSAATKKP